MEIKDKEQQETDKQAHKNNVEAQKRTNQILKEELEKLLQGPQTGKKWFDLVNIITINGNIIIKSINKSIVQ